MPIKSDREYRSLIVEVKDSEVDEKVVRGYFTTFESPYLLWARDGVEIWETVDSSAFDEADMSDVIFQYDHQGRVFARTSNGTLDLFKDEHGYGMEANLGGTTIGRQLFEEIKGGYTSKMSFGFTVTEDDYLTEYHEDGTVKETRIINRIGKLYDVSAVSLPANDQTEISSRNLADGVIDKVLTERSERMENRAKELRLKMMLRLKTMED